MHLKTERLVIKPYSDDDKDMMIKLLTNSKIKETFMIPDFKSKDEAVKMFDKLKAYSMSKEHYEAGIYLNNNLIGFVNDVEIAGDKIEMGYVISPDYHNNGYATEAFKGVIEELFREGFSEVVAGAFENNKQSIRVMEKCGMVQMEKEDFIEYQGILHRCVYYSRKAEKIIN